MTDSASRITVHMAASLDGFIARADGQVDWMETADEYSDGATMDAPFVEAFLATIDCYVMGPAPTKPRSVSNRRDTGGLTGTKRCSSSPVGTCR